MSGATLHVPPPRVRAAAALVHPWWREAWLRGSHASRTGRVRGSIGLALCAFVAAVAWQLSAATGRASVAAAMHAVAAHSGLAAVLAAAAAWSTARRVAQARVDALAHGWWRAAPAGRGAVDVVILAHISAIAVALAACAGVALGVMALLAMRAPPWHALSTIAAAIGAGAAIAGLQVAWRDRHPRMAYRAGLRTALWTIPWPRSPHAPHVFDWQRREALVRWRRGGGTWLVGMLVALTPGGTPPHVVAGMLLMAGVAGWLGTALHASGDVARDARAALRATPMDRMRLRRAAWGYPAFAVLATCTAFALGAALAGTGTLALWCAVAVLLSSRGVLALWHAGRAQ